MKNSPVLEILNHIGFFDKIFGAVAGCAVLCMFATFQKKAIGAPLVAEGYLVPAFFGAAAGFVLSFWHGRMRQAHRALQEAHEKLEIKVQERTQDLEIALSEIKTLKGILPICSHCKKIRDDRGYWNQIEKYIAEHSDANFSHGICPGCAGKLYPDLKLFDD